MIEFVIRGQERPRTGWGEPRLSGRLPNDIFSSLKVMGGSWYGEDFAVTLELRSLR
jgi:hypothetical protein